MDIPTAAVDGVPIPLPEGLVVLDVREDDEWEAGRLEGSVHIPLGELGERFTERPAGGQVLVVCRSGNRSAYATSYLVDQGIDAVNLAGGLAAWHGAGRPLTTDDGRPAQVL
jgi:rhodanese-related sulfurtransferase